MSATDPSLDETLEALPETGVLGAPRAGAEATADASRIEEARLMQERMALFGLVGASMSGLGFVVLLIANSVSEMTSTPAMFAVHFATIVICATSSLVARGRSRSKRFFETVDTVATVAVSACFALMVAELPPWWRPDLVASLVTLLITTSRATLVPSTPRRTLAVSVLAWLPVVVVTEVSFAEPFRLGGSEGVRSFLREAELETLLWSTLGITLATVTSHVIYGLRREVREARKLGQYTLLEKLGEGGMGQVFRAQHAMLRRPTAVKLLHAGSAGGTEELARFEREVQLTAQLSHPNVVTVFDYGRTPDGVFYYAMELLEGQNLEDVVAETGPMPAARAVHILAQVAGALAEAHAVGLIHRDIKPANIILCARGSARDVAKVVDFGLVKVLGQPEAAGDSGVNGSAPRLDEAAAALSRTGTVLGTPMYLAPETMRDPGAVDGRADLYALGAVAYFLLTGTTVFGGSSVAEACRHHVYTSPEPPAARLAKLHPGASLPADLEALVLACLHKSPAQRPAGADKLREALLACSVGRAWTEADAQAAWSAAPPRMPASDAARTETSWTAKTIAIDLAR